MESTHALDALTALAHDTRLAAFRLLLRLGPEGLPAGAVAAALQVPPSTLSFHLGFLERAGLARTRRVERHVYYAADTDGIAALLRFLIADCCAGRPDLCAALAPLLPAPDTPPTHREDAAMSRPPFNVLFLCRANAARSIMAEALLGALGGGRFRAFSAGSEPRGTVDPQALDLIRRMRLPTEELRSKSWSEFAAPDAPVMDFVFTVCDRVAGEPCPTWPGQPMTAHWAVPDPATAPGGEAQRGLAYAQAFRMLHARIGVFVNLPIDALDRIGLQRGIDSIGTLGAPDPAGETGAGSAA